MKTKKINYYKLHKEHLNGKPLYEVAKNYGVSWETINKNFKKLGLKAVRHSKPKQLKNRKYFYKKRVNSRF